MLDKLDYSKMSKIGNMHQFNPLLFHWTNTGICFHIKYFIVYCTHEYIKLNAER